MSLRFALDQLNFKQNFKVPIGYKQEINLFVCTFTNGYTKVIRFSDVDNTHITATNQEDVGEIEDENLSQMSIYEFNVSIFLQFQYINTFVVEVTKHIIDWRKQRATYIILSKNLG